MYEQAFRLSISSTDTNIKILEKQCKCYVAAINSLSLVKKEDAWIVKPFLNEDIDIITADSENKNVSTQFYILSLINLLKKLIF